VLFTGARVIENWQEISNGRSTTREPDRLSRSRNVHLARSPTEEKSRPEHEGYRGGTAAVSWSTLAIYSVVRPIVSVLRTSVSPFGMPRRSVSRGEAQSIRAYDYICSPRASERASVAVSVRRETRGPFLLRFTRVRSRAY